MNPIPYPLRQSYVYDIEEKKRGPFLPIILHFSGVKSTINHFFYDYCGFDVIIENDLFIAAADHRVRFLYGSVARFDDGEDVWVACSEVFCDEMKDFHSVVFLRHQYKQVINPMNKLFLKPYMNSKHGLNVLFKYVLKQGKLSFIPLPQEHTSDSAIVIRTGKGKKKRYIFNLFLIRHFSALRIQKAWKSRHL